MILFVLVITGFIRTLFATNKIEATWIGGISKNSVKRYYKCCTKYNCSVNENLESRGRVDYCCSKTVDKWGNKTRER
jgi:hypothetical protein